MTHLKRIGAEAPALIDRTEYSVEAYSRGYEEKLKFCTVLTQSGMIPAHIKTPQAAFAIMLRGQELGFHPMQSLEMFHSIQGVPTLKTQAALALCISRGGGAFHTLEESHEKVTVKGVRPGTNFEESVTWTIADAEKAGITGNPTWKKYPRSMLYWRAAGTLAKRGWADVIGGLFLYEEMHDEQYLAKVDGVEILPKVEAVVEEKRDKKMNDAQAVTFERAKQGNTYVFNLDDAKAAFGDDWKGYRVKLFKEGAVNINGQIHTTEPVAELERFLIEGPGRGEVVEGAA